MIALLAIVNPLLAILIAYFARLQDGLDPSAAAMLDKLSAEWQASARGGANSQPLGAATHDAAAATARGAPSGNSMRAAVPRNTMVSPSRHAAAFQASQQAADGAAAAGTSQRAGAKRPVSPSPRPLKRRALVRPSQEGF